MPTSSREDFVNGLIGRANILTSQMARETYFIEHTKFG